VTAQTSPLPIASPVSPAANTAQGVSSASNHAPVSSRPSSPEVAAGKPARTGQIPDGEVPAPLATKLRPAAKIGRGAALDLTAGIPDLPADANVEVPRASSSILPALPPALERPAPAPLVGGHLRGPQLVSRFLPDYPPVAKQIGVEGEVVIDAAVDATGKVTNMSVVSGPVLLQRAALDSVRKSKYEPSYLDGKPFPGQMIVTVQFHLH
jgi:TonB family protein